MPKLYEYFGLAVLFYANQTGTYHEEAVMTHAIINIVAAERVGDFQIRLGFDDGVVQVVDFKPFLARSQHPDIRAFLDPAQFAAFRIEYGELVWGDYELCFPIIDLYRNRLDGHDSMDAAA